MNRPPENSGRKSKTVSRIAKLCQNSFPLPPCLKFPLPNYTQIIVKMELIGIPDLMMGTETKTRPETDHIPNLNHTESELLSIFDGHRRNLLKKVIFVNEGCAVGVVIARQTAENQNNRFFTQELHEIVAQIAEHWLHKNGWTIPGDIGNYFQIELVKTGLVETEELLEAVLYAQDLAKFVAAEAAQLMLDDFVFTGADE